MISGRQGRWRPLEERKWGAHRRVWLLAGGCVAATYLAAAIVLLNGSHVAPAPLPNQADLGAVMIDLSPIVQRSASSNQAALSEPKQQAQAVSQPAEMSDSPEVAEAPVPPIAALPPVVDRLKTAPADVASQPEDRSTPLQSPAEESAGAPRSDDRAAATSAPSAGVANEAHSADWRSQFAAALNRVKRYPAGIRNVGLPVVRVRIDATGRLISAEIVGSSGSTPLDQAALDTVRRAAPFPAPPDGDQTLTFRMNFHRPNGR